MNKALVLILTLGCCSFGVVAGEQCQIVDKEFKDRPAKNLTFTNRLLDKLSFKIPPPNQMLYGSNAPILIYNRQRYVGYQLISERFDDKEKWPALLKSKWGFECDTPALTFKVKDFQVLVVDNEFKATNAVYKTVFFISNTKDYYYLIDFTGFTETEFEQILASIKQGE